MKNPESKFSNQLPTLTGCLIASATVKREVSRTSDGFPSLASMYRPATPVAFRAEYTPTAKRVSPATWC